MGQLRVEKQHAGVCNRRPLLVVALLQMAVLAAVVLGVSVLVATGNQALATTDGTSPVLIGFGILGPVLAVYLVVSHRARAFGFRKVQPRRWLAYLPAVVVLLVTVAANGFYLQQAPEVAVGRVVLLCLLVGFVEETVYRGMMVRLLLGRSVTLAVLVPTALFGLSHSLNLSSGQSPAATLGQVAFALSFGLCATMMWLIGKSVWPLIAFHGLYDFTVLTGPAVNESAVVVALNTIALVVGALVLALWYRTDRPGRGSDLAATSGPIPGHPAVVRTT